MDVESPPPLPQDEQPPLPSSAPAAAAADALPAPDAAGPSQPAKQREYRAEPVRAATPPAAAEAPVEPPGASNPAEESKKRKAKKAPAASVKRRARGQSGQPGACCPQQVGGRPQRPGERFCHLSPIFKSKAEAAARTGHVCKCRMKGDCESTRCALPQPDTPGCAGGQGGRG